MKDFNNMTEQQLKNVLTFTNALADRIEQDGQINFGELQTTDESLAEVEKSAREFATRRKAGLVARSGYGETTDEQAANH